MYDFAKSLIALALHMLARVSTKRRAAAVRKADLITRTAYARFADLDAATRAELLANNVAAAVAE